MNEPGIYPRVVWVSEDARLRVVLVSEDYVAVEHGRESDAMGEICWRERYLPMELPSKADYVRALIGMASRIAEIEGGD